MTDTLPKPRRSRWRLAVITISLCSLFIGGKLMVIVVERWQCDSRFVGTWIYSDGDSSITIRLHPDGIAQGKRPDDNRPLGSWRIRGGRLVLSSWDSDNDEVFEILDVQPGSIRLKYNDWMQKRSGDATLTAVYQ